MGDQKVKKIAGELSKANFSKHLLQDIEALNFMLQNQLFEDDVIRIGAEQEFCLVTQSWRPSKKALSILKEINDTHFTTEIAKYNLEINLDPVLLKNDAFTQVENQLLDLLTTAKQVAKSYKNHILLTGILPTITKRELQLDYMTPKPRYFLINKMLKKLRGGDFRLNIRGVDELNNVHDSVLYEGCNTSFQMHLQIPSHDFIASYNWALAVSGIVLSMCTNSPLLLGRELWNETRIALFKQSIDTRKSSYVLKNQEARVAFGSNSWASGSVVEIFKNLIAQHDSIITKEILINSLETVKKGTIPKLEALCTFNGTIYRWNRACYGITNNKPHLRIENRYIPSGPSVKDEMANFAFWVGLMMGRPSKYDDMEAVMDFRDAKANFIKAARYGKETLLFWDKTYKPATDLVLNTFLPIAYDGLQKMNISSQSIYELLGVIEERAKSQTGSEWMVSNYRKLSKHNKQDDALQILTQSIHDFQKDNTPVSQWRMLRENEKLEAKKNTKVNHIMTTRLFVVHKNDLASLATSIMKWKNIHHVPVESKKGKLVGLLTWTHMAKLIEEKQNQDISNYLVKDIMVKKVFTVTPQTSIKKAVSLMEEHNIGCLPVIQKEYLVGIITAKDLIEASYE